MIFQSWILIERIKAIKGHITNDLNNYGINLNQMYFSINTATGDNGK